jgi:endonuclease YncB( thermonuclease family)
MVNKTVLTDSKYGKLILDLKKIIQEGRRRAKAAVARENVQMYWEVGKRITEERLIERAGYGDSIYEDISEDLGLDDATIKQSVSFFGAYSNSSPRGINLTWSHYRELAVVADRGARRWYEAQASEEDWTRDRLVRAIKNDFYGEAKAGAKGGGRIKRPAHVSYIYKAEVIRVVDGDTLLVRFDLGFTVEKRQRIRLAEIDCDEKDTRKGYQAFEFVRDRLAQAPFIVVKTHQVDIHGRYVGHVFYSFDAKKIEQVFEEGKYLNQELLDRGHARRI